MKAACLVVFSLALPAAAQVAAPATPGKFTSRTVGGAGGTAGVSIHPTPQAASTKARLVSHFSLCEARQWKSSDGRSVVGSLIAFEDAVVEIDAATPAAAREAALKAPPATLPAKLTLVRDGKVRLLVSNKPFEIMLDRLSSADRQFVEDLRQRMPQ